MAIIRIWDAETTSEPPDAEIIEAGWSDYNLETGEISDPIQYFVKTNRKVDISARAIHHITDEEIQSGISYTEMDTLLKSENPIAYAAHNAVVEKGLWGHPKPLLCTMKCSMRFFPEAGKFSNQYLRYWFDTKLNSKLAHPPHRAGPDAYVTAHIVRKLLEKASVEELIRVSNEPVLLPNIPFGKYKGLTWDKSDVGYLQWIIKQDSFDENVIYTARKELNRRTGGY